VVADVLTDSSGAAPAQLFALLSDARATDSALGDGKALVLFSQAYRQIAGLPSAQAAYRLLFTGIDPAARAPILFHCTTGKDRTGWAAAALLMLLGVPDELVMQEYLLTNDQLLPSLEPMFDRFRQQGVETEVLRQVMGVEPAYLTAALDQMRSDFGTIEAYFDEGLGIDAAAQASLRAALVEQP
jgi:protein-tyrosine phosphatase